MSHQESASDNKCKYTLKFHIDDADLTDIRGGHRKITVARHFGVSDDILLMETKPSPAGANDTSSDASTVVIWFTIDPFPTTTVGWDDNYWIYASNSPVVAGEEIQISSEVSPGPAVLGGCYPFADAVFGAYEPATGNAANAYSAVNWMPAEKYSRLTFGLSQPVRIDGVLSEHLPIRGSTVPSKYKIVMLPTDSVSIWLQSKYDPKTVLNAPPSDALIVKLNAETPEVNVRYDGTDGLFKAV